MPLPGAPAVLQGRGIGRPAPRRADDLIREHPRTIGACCRSPHTGRRRSPLWSSRLFVASGSSLRAVDFRGSIADLEVVCLVKIFAKGVVVGPQPTQEVAASDSRRSSLLAR